MSTPEKNSTTPDNTGRKQDGTFVEGQSGNPSGRPAGSRNKTTLAVQALLDGEAEEISRKAIERAKEGDMAAIRLILERVLPPRKDAPVMLEIPPIKTPEDVTAAIAAIIEHVAQGNLTPGEAQNIAPLLDSMRRSIETQELEQRLAALEERSIGR